MFSRKPTTKVNFKPQKSYEPYKFFRSQSQLIKFIETNKPIIIIPSISISKYTLKKKIRGHKTVISTDGFEILCKRRQPLEKKSSII